jgi:hypothetical protein
MNERMMQIEELKELKTKLLSEQEANKQAEQQSENTNQNNTENTTKQQETYQLVKANPSIPSLLDKTGFSNVIYLASMSLMFEILFLAISFFIFK